ncbi:MAG: DUF7004 family protein [Petrimonas sp.]|jgi:hypothetical protein|nr:MAG: hypothetical protein BWZ00_00608 [Bacteroidetes bacterium ADurb.BinA174]
MSRLIKKLRNNRCVVFDTGRFDDWCVYVVESDGTRNAPHDETYFSDLFEISKKYSTDKVYNDFVLIYNITIKEIIDEALLLIDNITATYNREDQTIVEQWFTVIYAGMIAEENKENAILKKRIKRLGMHQVLKLGMPVKNAAKFSYGKKWRELDSIMKTLGF